MMKKQNGFTLIELLLSMVMFLLVITAATNVFTPLLTQFKQQTKISETKIEGIIGLELLRRDIEHAGLGLPWDLNGASYNEAGIDLTTPWVDRDFNDGPPDNPARGTDLAGASNPPGAVRSGNGVALNGSDVLVIKSSSVATDEASRKWSHLYTGNTVKEWVPASERLVTNDRLIVLEPGNNKTLTLDAASDFTVYYDATTGPDSLSDAAFAPAADAQTRIVYGITDPANPVTTALRMPFNRADYYVRIPANMPDRCAAGTGVLYKATVNQGDAVTTAGELSELPLIDCVANMQVVYTLDTGAVTNDISALTAMDIRDTVREVRIDILAHEGQRDPYFTFTNFTPAACATCIRVGVSAILGRDFDLTAITDYLNYRWKLYTLSVTTENLR